MESLVYTLCAHVLPALEDYAGAIESGVHEHIFIRYRSAGASNLVANIKFIEDQLAQSAGAIDGFLALDTEQREHILQALVEDDSTGFADAWKVFIKYCLDGYLSDPRWGGNKNGLGWQALGLHGPRFPQVSA